MNTKHEIVKYIITCSYIHNYIKINHSCRQMFSKIACPMMINAFFNSEQRASGKLSAIFSGIILN